MAAWRNRFGSAGFMRVALRVVGALLGTARRNAACRAMAGHSSASTAGIIIIGDEILKVRAGPAAGGRAGPGVGLGRAWSWAWSRAAPESCAQGLRPGVRAGGLGLGFGLGFGSGVGLDVWAWFSRLGVWPGSQDWASGLGFRCEVGPAAWPGAWICGSVLDSALVFVLEFRPEVGPGV